MPLIKFNYFYKKLYYDYVFNQVDHQGNIRMSYTDANRDGVIGSFTEQYCAEPNLLGGCNRYEYRNVNEVLEENHYYPYGLKHFNYNTLLSKYQKDPLSEKRRPVNTLALDYKYKYVGKEWQDELNLNVYALDYRQYDPALGRFSSQDVLAEKAYSITPYRYGFNNPVFWRDPLGLYEDDWGYDDWGESERDQFEPGRGIQLADIVVMGWNRFERLDDDFCDRLGFFDMLGKNEYNNDRKGLELFIGTAESIGGFASSIVNNRFKCGKKYGDKTITIRTKLGPGINLNSSKLEKLKKVGKLAGKTTKALAIADVALSGEIRASLVLTTAMIGINSIPLAGNVISGLYFGADFITMGVSYLNTGEAYGIGDYLDQVLDGGVIINAQDVGLEYDGMY